MIGLLLSLFVSLTAPPSASVTCPEWPASCDAAAVGMAADADSGESVVADAPRYATPAVIDCRTTVVPAVLATLVGECDGMPRDASYRVSRYPESEQSGGTLTPATPRERRHVTSCDGVPADGGDLTVSPAQPAALYASPPFVLAAGRAAPPGLSLTLPFRTRDRLDRPPRA
jgi:hypothetical protein